MRHFTDREKSRTHFKKSARNAVVTAQIEVDVDLIPTEWPALSVPGDQSSRSGIHQSDLHAGMGGAVGSARRRPRRPVITDKTQFKIEFDLIEYHSLPVSRSADNQLDRTLNLGSLPNLGKSRGDRVVEMIHGPTCANYEPTSSNSEDAL